MAKKIERGSKKGNIIMLKTHPADYIESRKECEQEEYDSLVKISI